jgi:hypothetical protein
MKYRKIFAIARFCDSAIFRGVPSNQIPPDDSIGCPEDGAGIALGAIGKAGPLYNHSQGFPIRPRGKRKQ